MQEELEFHLAMREKSLRELGMSPDDARAEAERQFGNFGAVRADCVTIDRERDRAMSRASLFADLRQDVAYAVRSLRHNIGFTAIAVATLALGIGANTSIFVLIDAVLLRRLPVPDPQELVVVGDASRVGGVSSGSPRPDLLSYRAYHALRDQNTVFSGMLASGRAPRLFVTEKPGEEPESPTGRIVSGNYFSVLRVPALLGRTFGPDEDGNVGASPVAVISYDWWQRRFDGNPNVIGRTIRVNNVGITIVGVAPQWFTGEIVGSRPSIWLPITMQPVIQPNDDYLKDSFVQWLLFVGRLRPGVTLEQAHSQIMTLLPRLLKETSNNADFTNQVDRNVKPKDVLVTDGSRGLSRVRQAFFVPLMTLMAGVGLLLLIVCANVANLLLARATARAREMNLRVALGAGRFRLVRQLLTESTVLALLGAAAGLLVGWWGSKLLVALTADGGTAIPINVAVGGKVAAFTIASALLSVFIFGLAPALTASRVRLADAMRAHSRSLAGMSARHGRISPTRAVIMAQVALSLLLLVGAGLLVRSMYSLQDADVGMDRDHLLVADLDTRTPGYIDAKFAPLADQLTQRVAQLPGVAAVSYSENGLFNGTESGSTVGVEGFVVSAREDSLVHWDEVGPNYAHTIGAHIVEGRDLQPSDRGKGATVVLVNRTLARFYFKDASAVGKWIKLDSTTYFIVGVITDAQDHDLRAEPVRRVYFPYLNPVEYGNLRLIVRTTGNPAALANLVRREVVAQDASIPIISIESLPALLRTSIRSERLVAKLATAFGILALLLAAVGLYGVMSYAISQRTAEIGLRVALGAQRGDVIAMVLRDALGVVVIGIGAGLALSLFVLRFLEALLFGVKPADPLSIVGAAVVLLLSGALAALVPAMRGSRIAPLEALREG